MIAPVFEWKHDAPKSDLEKIRYLMNTQYSDKPQRAFERAWTEGPVHVRGGHKSTDNDWLQMVKDVVRLFGKQGHKPSVDELGRVFGNGLRSEIYGILHVPGFPMSTATWPLYDNREKRKNMGLSDHFVEPWHRNLYEAWVRLMFTGITPEPMRIRKGSSTCVPLFESNIDKRIELAKQAFLDAEAAGKLMLKGQHGTAFRLYMIGGVYYVVFRRQSSDKVEVSETGVITGKPRQVADREYAISGGLKGKLFFADKSFQVSDLTPEVTPLMATGGFLRQRLRVATAIPGSLGATLTAIMQPVRTHMYEEYGFTYHHSTRTQKRDKLRQFDFAIAADVSDHDTVWPLWIVEQVLKPTLLDLGYADWWVELLVVSMHLPIYIASVNAHEGRTLIGDWEKPDSNLGLSSGNPGTDIFGSWNMSIVYLITQIQHCAPHYARDCDSVKKAMDFLHSYLKGEFDIALMDKSDDAELLFRGSPSRAALALQHRMKDGDTSISPYMVISYEHGGAFLGDILLYDSTRSLHGVELIGNINSFLVNMMCPEYSAAEDRSDTHSGYMARSRSKRPYPGLSWESAPAVYGNCQLYGDIVDILNEAYFNNFRVSFEAEQERLLAEDRELLYADMKRRAKEMKSSSSIDVRDLTTNEVEVLTDVDKISWKYTQPNDVRPEVRELLTHAVPLEFVEPYFNSIMKNVRS